MGILVIYVQCWNVLRTSGAKRKARNLTFLGHVLSSKSNETDKEKIATLRDWSTPANVKLLGSFLRVPVNYGTPLWSVKD